MQSNQALPLAGMRILFVEDAPELRELMIDFLEELGAEVIAVSLAKQGVKVAKLHPSAM